MIAKLVLEYRFTILQKLMILAVIALFLMSAISLITQFFTENRIIHSLLNIISYSTLIIIAFSKRGFLAKANKLFSGLFFIGIPIFKSRIDLSKMNKLAVLKFRKSQKLPWFSIARPDLAAEFNSFENNILNENHTKRNIIIELKKQKNVKPTIDFLTTHTNLVFEKYNPKTRRVKRKRRR